MLPAPLTTAGEIDAECGAMNLSDALQAIPSTSSTPPGIGVGELVHVIVRLAESKRAWFITAAQPTATGLQAVGFESGCIRSPGRWFKVTADFFDVVARANAEALVIEVLDPPAPLAAMEDTSL
jgi:hypothetical protein